MFWAEFVSRDARQTERGRAPAGRLDSVDELRRRFHVSDRELAAILAEAEAAKWADSPSCQPSSEPYFTNSLLLPPEPVGPIEGRETPEACRRKLQGVVILSAVIRRNGTASDAAVSRGIDPELDRQAIRAVESTPWWPALLCARPADVHFNVSVPFRLSSCGAGR